ncbi:metaxin [Chloropicon primus]|uniref:Metaxin n=1 Tax=Chloropicon primus TaxID=1764295 RepID=A0A5B8MIX3_9CHLO|nr:metaxin [Chloropicon primus]UPQ99266.1 metaxin [Chloropicon primus]|eukprot:QDZ20054.1 metaxin [Chloropicon primus]
MACVTLYKFEAAWGLPSFSYDCIHAEAYLRLYGVKFQEEASTSENSSPTGTLPCVDIDGVAMGAGGEGGGAQGNGSGGSGGALRDLVEGLKKAGLDLDAGLSVEDQSDLEAYMSLVENALVPTTRWALWCDDQSYSECTRAFYAKIYPFPLSYIFPWKKRQEALAKMKTMNVRSEEQVLDLLAKVYNCLTKKLKGKKYFFGRPTRLDAAVYAHILYHKSSPVGELLFGSTLKNYPALSKYVDDISRAHFGPEAAALKDPASIAGIRLKRRRKKKPQAEEDKVFKYRRNAWLGVTVSLTVTFLLSKSKP